MMFIQAKNASCKFVDLCGTIHDVRKAWNRHIKLFPHLIRNTSLCEHPSSYNQLLNITNEGRESNPPTLPNQPSRGCTPDHMIQPPKQNNVECSPKGNPIQETRVFTGQTQTQKGDEIVQEQIQEVSLIPDVEPRRDASGADDSTDDLVNQSENASVEMESTHDQVCQPEEGASGQLESTVNMVHASIEDASRPDDLSDEFEQPSKPIETLEALQEYPTALTIQHGTVHELPQHSDSLSLESLTLKSQEKETQDVVSMASDDNDKRQETSTSNGTVLEGADRNPSSSSPNRNLVTHSAETDNELDANELVTPPCSVSYENPMPREAHPLSDMLQNNGENEHQMNHMLMTPENAGSGFQGFSPGQRKRQQQSSPQQHSNAENGPNVLVNQDYSRNPLWKTQGQNQSHMGASQGNTRTSRAWKMENMPQHTSFSASQSQMSPIPVSHPQPHIINYPVQNSQQLEHSQYSGVYSQMLQYHYQQQFLQQQYQQQFLQMQQSYFQQQQLQQQQSYQQWQQVQPQPNQMSELQHQHNFQLQQQLQPELHLPQQLQQQHYLHYQQQDQQQQQQQQIQLQQQQYQQLAQQLQPQQGQQQQQHCQLDELAYQQHQQEYQQQAEQGYQLLLQQYRLQQEQQYQQMLHQYQLQQQEEYQQPGPRQQEDQQPEQQQQDEEWQDQQQNTSTHSQTQHGNNYQQGQRIQAAQNVGAPGSAESLHSPRSSQQVATPSHSAGASVSLSSLHLQPQPHGASPSHRVSISRQAMSSHLE